MRMTFVFAVTVALAASLALGGASQTSGIGAAAFLRRGVDARALGMGGAHVAVVDGYASMYWNPAGLARGTSIEVGGMTTNIYGADIFLNFLAGVAPWSLGGGVGTASGGLGPGVSDEGVVEPSEDESSQTPRPGRAPFEAAASGIRVAVGVSFTEMATEVRAYDELGNPLGVIRYTEALYGLGGAAWVPRLGYAGGVVKAYSFRAPRAGVGGADATAFGLGFDLGIAVPVWEGLWLGIAAADVGNSQVRWRNTPLEPTDRVSARYSGGVAYVAEALLLGDDRLIVAADASLEPLIGAQAYRAGVEYRLLFLFLRGGVTFRPGTPLAAAAGLGVRAGGLSVDGAWVQNRELQVEGAGHTIVISASFRF